MSWLFLSYSCIRKFYSFCNSLHFYNKKKIVKYCGFNILKFCLVTRTWLTEDGVRWSKFCGSMGSNTRASSANHQKFTFSDMGCTTDSVFQPGQTSVLLFLYFCIWEPIEKWKVSEECKLP